MKHLFPTIKIRLAVLATLVVFFILSCKKLIEIPPTLPSQINQEKIFSDSADIMNAIAGVYNNFNVSSGVLSYFNGGLAVYTGECGDELVYISSIVAVPTDLEYYQDNISAFNNTTLPFWDPVYNELYQVNICLEKIAAANNISAAFKQQLLGELKVVRALHYFYLVNLFGPVPLVIQSDYRINAAIGRTSVDSVYAQIISDLSDARQKLKAGYPSAGRARPNLYTADALLAKVYLYRKRWADAEAIATEVIGSNVYSLVTDLSKVFLDGSAEAIWQLPANGVSFQTIEAKTFIPTLPTYPPAYSMSTSAMAALSTSDQRRTKWLGTKVISGTTYYYPVKYKNTAIANTPIEDYTVFRLADQYLIRAEARAQQNKTADGIADWNMVHQRAGLPAGNAAGAADLLDSLMLERRNELFCEWGNRWLDLKRWGAIDAVLGAEKTTWQPYIALWPIPYSELQANPLLEQNPGNY